MYFLNPNLIKNDGYLSFSHQYLDEIKESNNYVNLKDHFGATPNLKWMFQMFPVAEMLECFGFLLILFIEKLAEHCKGHEGDGDSCNTVSSSTSISDSN